VRIARALIATLTATFLLVTCARAGDKETSLYNFNGGLGKTENGIFPHGLLLANSGNLYGAALSGATGNVGGIFELTPTGSGGWTYNLIVDCDGVCNGPLGSLLIDGSGNLFGVAISSDGVVFELSPDGLGGWTASTVYAFSGGTNGYDGYSPTPGLVIDAAGNLDGTNFDGGINNNGYVFELSPDGGGMWTLTHLHDFIGTDGSQPATTVTRDAVGNLYGTTQGGGGSSQCTNGCGVAYELTSNSGAWTETILHIFHGPDGSSLQGTLLLDTAGNLYGTATAGGAHGFGVVFEISPSTKGWKTRALYAFKSGTGDGAAPYNDLIMDATGNLFGTTWSGGGGDCNVGTDVGCGTAFRLTRNGNKWKESILHDFTGGGDGAFPEGLIFGPGGDLYGVAPAGGGLFGGLAYELSLP
jgi:uncharacterized repeat protein (TIGR03803 family)